MNLDINVILSLGIGAVISLTLIFYLYMKKEEINEVFREKIRVIKEEKKFKQENDITLEGTSELEQRLNGLLNKVSKNVIRSEKMAKITGKNVGMKAKLGKSIVSTISNPYNNTNSVKMFILVCLFCGSGVMASVILANPAMGIATFVMGLIMPFTMVTLNGLRRKLRIMKGNLHFLSVHLPNYLDSSTLEESLRRSLKSLSSGSIQHKAANNCLQNMIELNMTQKDALERLKKDLLADKYVNDYIEIVERAETLDRHYKEILSSIIKNFEELVISNDKIVNFSYWLYMLYIGAVAGMIVVVGILKSSDPETYTFLANTAPGQAAVLVVFMIATVIGIVMSSAADLINLDITKKKESDPLKEDIYV